MQDYAYYFQSNFILFQFYAVVFAAKVEGEQCYLNDNLTDIVTPIDVNLLEQLLNQSSYDPKEMKFFVSGFREGFDLQYRGPLGRKDILKIFQSTMGLVVKMNFGKK